MATKLQEARERVREAENARIALDAKHKAEDEAQAPAKLALERHLKRNNAPIVVLTAGSYRIFADGLGSLSGYGWIGEVRRETEGYKGKAREERAIALVANGGVTYNLGGTSLKCKGLAQKARTITGTHLRLWSRAHEKVRRAQEALRLATAEEQATILAAYNAGDKMTVDQIAAVSARRALLEGAVHVGDPWSRDRAIKEAREACGSADVHLVHLLEKKEGPCPCVRCAAERRMAEYEKAAEVKRKEEEKKRAAMQKIKDRAPWREFTCPTCGEVGVAQVLPYSRPYGPESTTLTLQCPVRMCGKYTVAAHIKTKPAKKPEAQAAA